VFSAIELPRVRMMDFDDNHNPTSSLTTTTSKISTLPRLNSGPLEQAAAPTSPTSPTSPPKAHTHTFKSPFYPFPEEYYQCGFVMKEGAVNTDFRKRWLMFEGDELSYYIKETMRDKKGSIPLKKIRSVYQLRESYKGRENVFILSLDTRNFVLQAPTPPDSKLWVDAISKMKEYFEAVSSSFMLECAIDVDDPSFDLGEETTNATIEENPSALMSKANFKTPDWKESMEQARIRGGNNSTKFVGVIGQTRSRNNGTIPHWDNHHNTLGSKGDYYDRDEDEDDESVVEEDLNGREFGEKHFEALDKVSKLVSLTETVLNSSPPLNTDDEPEIDNIIQEMKKSLKFYQICFIGFTGSELIDWLSQWKRNWPAQKSKEYATKLLTQNIIIEVLPSASSNNSDFQMNSLYKFPFNISSNFYQIPGNLCPGLVAINVGGQIFHTTEKTLSSIPNTFFFYFIKSASTGWGLFYRS